LAENWDTKIIPRAEDCLTVFGIETNHLIIQEQTIIILFECDFPFAIPDSTVYTNVVL
jgi:hypothetical protein